MELDFSGWEEHYYEHYRYGNSHILKLYANYYYNLGLNITTIGNESFIDFEDFLEYWHEKNIEKITYLFKSTRVDLKKYKSERQTLEFIMNLSWFSPFAGIGTVLGFNNLRALDIDGCSSIEFIEELLETLNLNNKYEWVVRSGSQNGFHILFYCEEHTFDEYFTIKNEYFPCIFYPNKTYNDIFKRIELRWSHNLVLPPSDSFIADVNLNSYEIKSYEFVNCKLPDKAPALISSKLINKVHTNFCLETNRKELAKIKEEDKLYLVSTKDTFLFFDVETTGLFHEKLQYNSWERIKDFPRLTQLAWIRVDSNWNILEECEYLIEPEDFDIPIDSTRVHGITNEKARLEGFPIQFVLNEFIHAVFKSSQVISYNLKFDWNIIMCECSKTDHSGFTTKPLNDHLFYLEEEEYYNRGGIFRGICLMEIAKFLKTNKFLTVNSKYDYPKLRDLYKALHGEYPAKEHNAIDDVKSLKSCFYRLLLDGSFNIIKKYGVFI